MILLSSPKSVQNITHAAQWPDDAVSSPAAGVCKTSYTELVSRIRRGEPSAVNELYCLLQQGVRWLLVRQLGASDADDAFHDVFITLLAEIRNGSLRDPGQLLSYARKIISHTVARVIEKRVRDRIRLVGDEIEIPDSKQDLEKALIDRRATELMMRVLLEMPAKDRDILQRFYLREQTQEEICHKMRLTPTQFRLLKSRAKARFGELGRRKTTVAGNGGKGAYSGQPTAEQQRQDRHERKSCPRRAA